MAGLHSDAGDHLAKCHPILAHQGRQVLDVIVAELFESIGVLSELQPAEDLR